MTMCIALSRLFPTQIETQNLPDIEENKKPASVMAEEELAGGRQFPEEEQYTWDMCLVFQVLLLRVALTHFPIAR